jgi:hypothetical protein
MAKKKKKHNRSRRGSGKRTVSIKPASQGREEQTQQGYLPIAALNKRLEELNRIKKKKIEVDRIRARARERRGEEDE